MHDFAIPGDDRMRCDSANGREKETSARICKW